jgi:predicted small integral membrane protein
LNTGSTYSFNLSNSTQATSITPGTAVSGRLLPSNQTDLYQFNAVAGERFFVDYLSFTGSSHGTDDTYWSLVDPDGNLVFDRAFNSDVGEITLSKTGTYTLLMEGAVYEYLSSSYDSRYSFNILPMEEEPTPLTLGQTVSSTMARDRYSFSLDSNSQLYFDSLTNDGNFKWTIKGTNGTTYYNNRSFTASDGDNITDPILNLAAGEYILDIDGVNAGSIYSFTLKDINTTAANIIPGVTVTGNFNPARETDIYQFEAVAGERFFIDYLDGSYSHTRWRLIAPDGSYVFNNGFSGDIGDKTFNQTGTYTLLMEDDIQYHNNDNYQFNLRPMATTPKAIAIGEKVTGDITQDEYSFSVDQNKWIYFDSFINSSYTWKITDATGQVIRTRQFNNSDGAVMSSTMVSVAISAIKPSIKQEHIPC